MKYTLILCLLILAFSANAQEKRVSFTKQGFEPLVASVEGLSANELHANTKEWVTLNFVSPKNAISGDIEGKVLKINGFSEQQACYKSIGIKTCFDLQYIIEFQFRDGRFRILIDQLEIINETRHPGCDL